GEGADRGPVPPGGRAGRLRRGRGPCGAAAGEGGAQQRSGGGGAGRPGRGRPGGAAPRRQAQGRRRRRPARKPVTPRGRREGDMTAGGNKDLIALEKVSMQFGGQAVLRNVNLTVGKGETLVVIGESGCGKTVLLKLVIGLLWPTTGRVTFDGRVMAHLPARELTRQRQRFGYLFQNAALFDSLTVYDNVAMGLRAQGVLSEAAIRERVGQRLQEVGLPPAAAARRPAELSGGMKK